MSRLRRALMPEYRAFVPDVFPNGKSGSTQLTHHHPIPHIPHRQLNHVAVLKLL